MHLTSCQEPSLHSSHSPPANPSQSNQASHQSKARTLSSRDTLPELSPPTFFPLLCTSSQSLPEGLHPFSALLRHTAVPRCSRVRTCHPWPPCRPRDPRTGSSLGTQRRLWYLRVGSQLQQFSGGTPDCAFSHPRSRVLPLLQLDACLAVSCAVNLPESSSPSGPSTEWTQDPIFDPQPRMTQVWSSCLLRAPFGL